MADVPLEEGEDTGSVYDELWALIDSFERQLRVAGLVVKFDVDVAALWNACGSYVQDLNRYVEYHELQVPDRARRAAYLCKWLMRFRPLSIQAENYPTEENENKHVAVMINETLCAWVVAGRLRVDWEKDVGPNVFLILMYSLRYRAAVEDTFILLFSYLCRDDPPIIAHVGGK